MGNFTFTKTSIPDIQLIKPTLRGDTRGYFMETWHEEEFKAAGISCAFKQDNQSKSSKGVLRGLHFQRQNTQGKLVRVTKGRIFDVAVDVRPNSPYFGKWVGEELNDENHHQLFVPEGFAHGFFVLSETAEFLYKCTNVYSPAHEGGVLWNDAEIGIAWPIIDAPVLLSEKDAALPAFAAQTYNFFERWLK